MKIHAQDEAQAGKGRIDPAHSGLGPASVQQGHADPAESGVEFKDHASVTFNLKNLADCRFLFGKYGDEVYANEHNRNVETSFVIAEVDAKTNTIYIRPC